MEKKSLEQILDAYTQLIVSMYSCVTLDQLKNCAPLINNFDAFNDHSNKFIWTQKANYFYKKQYEKLNAHNVRSVDTEAPNVESVKSELKQDADGIFVTEEFKQQSADLFYYALDKRAAAVIEKWFGEESTTELKGVEAYANSLKVVPDIEFCDDVPRDRAELLDDRAREMAETEFPDFVEHH